MSQNKFDGSLIEENKFLFGLYLNQARLNAYVTLSHISDILSTGTVVEENLSNAQVLNYLSNWKDPVKSKRAYDLIEHHFPMLKAMLDMYIKRLKDKEQTIDISFRAQKYKEYLSCLLKAIHLKRDYCCHVKSEDKFEDKIDINMLIRCLEDCFDTSVNIVKERLELFEDGKNDNNPKDECLHLRRFKGTEKADRRKKAKLNPKFNYHFKDDKNPLTDKGLAFLISIFLGKDDAFRFLKTSGLKGFKRDTDNRGRSTLLSYCALRIKPAHPKVTSDDNITNVALDIFGDLQKCPREIFNLLSRDDQEKFRIAPDTGSDIPDEDVLLMRYSDRFAGFAMRFCDEKRVFKHLRFQVDLGRYYYKFYPKQAADGNEYPRQLDKRLKTFGRLGEVKGLIKTQWESNGVIKEPSQLNDKTDSPYVRKTSPHYHIVDNQICMAIVDKTELPQLDGENGVKPKASQPSRAWISIHQMVGLIFHGLTCGFDKTEHLIQKYIKNQEKAICNIHEGQEISEELRQGKFFPKALSQNPKKELNTYTSNKLQTIIADTKKRQRGLSASLERVVDKSNKPGKTKFIQLKAGKIADFLVKDMLKLQPFDPSKDGSDKATSLNFQLLQESIALFGAKKHSLTRIWKNLKLIDSDIAHPFLNRLKDPAGHGSIIDFYRDYLDKKMVYLKSLNDDKLADIQFLRPTRQSYCNLGQSIQTIAKGLKGGPVNLPNNLFKDDIETFVVGKIPSLAGKEANTAYLIQQYFTFAEGGHQRLYSCQKTYPVIKKAQEYIKKRENKSIFRVLSCITNKLSYNDLKTLVKDNIPDRGRYEPQDLKKYLLDGCREFKNNERTIRKFKIQDSVAFMMFKDILTDVFSAEVVDETALPDRQAVISQENQDPLADSAREILSLKLENIYYNKDRSSDSIFTHPMPQCRTEMSITVNSNLTYEKEHVEHADKKYKDMDGYIVNDHLRKIGYQLVLNNTKLKDAGKARRLINDRRLPRLLTWKYKPLEDVDFDDIQNQINALKQHRIDIARVLNEFEKRALNVFDIQPKDNSQYVSFHQVINAVKANLPGFEGECDMIMKIRNAVNHNQIPVFDKVIDEAKGDAIAAKMLNITESYVEQILINLPKDNDQEFENALSIS